MFNDIDKSKNVKTLSAGGAKPVMAGFASKVTGSQQRLLQALGDGPKTTAQLATTLGVTPDFVRKSLRVLIETGAVARDGGPGQPSTTYRRS
jgi:predicted ArsR family transcriptional regulator